MIVRSQVITLVVMVLCLASGLHAQVLPVPGTPTEGEKTLSASGPQLPDPFRAATEFSATMDGSISGPISQGKVYRSGNQFRSDMPKGYTVTNLDKLNHFSYYPEGQHCFQGPLPAGQAFPFTLLKNAKVVATAAGVETVDGHVCDVEDVSITTPDKPELRLKVWAARDLKGFPIKMERVTGMGRTKTQSFRDVQVGPQNPELFKKSANCQASPAPGEKGTQTVKGVVKPAPKPAEKSQSH